MKKLIALALVFSLGLVSAVTAAEPRDDDKISTYLQSEFISAKDVESKLTAAGFEIVTTFKSIKKGKTVIFTCPTLKKEAAKPGRASIAIMRAFADEEGQVLSITNPVYFGKAYMQKDFNYETFSKVKAKIEATFTGLKGSEDSMAYEDLAGFHFTFGMPYYEDAKKIGKGTNAELLEKLKTYKKGKLFVFELAIDEDTTLVGYKIGRGTERFAKKIGRANAGLLPWTIVVDDGKATMLQAEYYIALTYPQLGMGQFAGIASVPGDIIKDLKKPLKK